MERRFKVLIYGDTLVLGCLRASLAAYERIELTSLDAPDATVQQLCSLQPDVIIFDIEAVHPASLYSLAWKLPHLRLVGIDPNTNRVTVWSGQQLSELSTGEFVEVIGRESGFFDRQNHS